MVLHLTVESRRTERLSMLFKQGTVRLLRARETSPSLRERHLSFFSKRTSNQEGLLADTEQEERGSTENMSPGAFQIVSYSPLLSILKAFLTASPMILEAPLWRMSMRVSVNSMRQWSTD